MKKIYLLIGMTAASVLLAGVSAQAQTTQQSDRNTLAIAENEAKIAPSFNSKDASNLMAQVSAPSDGTSAPLDGTVPSDGTQPAPIDNTIPSDGTQTIPSTQTPPSDGTPTTPSTDPTPPPSDGSNPPFSDVEPGRATRSGSSYIGVGGNIGIGGNTGIGEGSFSVISKVGLTRNFSARPSVLFGDDITVLLPVTVDFPTQNVETARLNIAPYIGGGAIISTGDSSNIGVLLTGGVDVPINSQFTATAGLNVGFVDDTDVGVILGVGYNFSGL